MCVMEILYWDKQRQLGQNVSVTEIYEIFG